ncbi:MAG: hypothetical protein J3K34DRAFT_433342 [Monoraphidium minutum]|nr:MAG: hypothetical protein J3K34DRAFT_433342 [Monoraphidium minutum]
MTAAPRGRLVAWQHARRGAAQPPSDQLLPLSAAFLRSLAARPAAGGRRPCAGFAGALPPTPVATLALAFCAVLIAHSTAGRLLLHPRRPYSPPCCPLVQQHAACHACCARMRAPRAAGASHPPTSQCAGATPTPSPHRLRSAARPAPPPTVLSTPPIRPHVTCVPPRTNVPLTDCSGGMHFGLQGGRVCKSN